MGSWRRLRGWLEGGPGRWEVGGKLGWDAGGEVESPYAANGIERLLSMASILSRHVVVVEIMVPF